MVESGEVKSPEQFFDFAAEAGLTKHLGGVVPRNLHEYFGYGL